MKTEEIERLEEMLKGGIVEFTYLNRNGDREHSVRGTTTPLHVMFRPRRNDRHIIFYDMDAERWRRCSKDHVTGTGRYIPWDTPMRIELEPEWVNVVTHTKKEEPKPENRFVKFFENVWSAIRSVLKRPDKVVECKVYTGIPEQYEDIEIYDKGGRLPYDEAEIEDVEYEEIV